MTIAGIVSMFQLPSNIYPELTFPRIVVLVKAGDLSPDTTLLTVTRPIEEQVLQKVRRALNNLGLITRTNAHKKRGAYRSRVRNVAGNNTQAVGKPGDLDRHAALPAATWPRIWASTAARSLASTAKRSGRR